MRTIKSEFAYTDLNGVDWYRCVIVSETKPDTLPTSGADVDGIPDIVGIAAGSVMLTPDGNELYYSDDAVLTPSSGAKIGITNNTGSGVYYALYTEFTDEGFISDGTVSANGELENISCDSGNLIFFQIDRTLVEITVTGDAEDQQYSGPVGALFVVNGDASFTVKNK